MPAPHGRSILQQSESELSPNTTNTARSNTFTLRLSARHNTGRHSQFSLFVSDLTLSFLAFTMSHTPNPESTRREELLLSKQEQDFVYLMRRMYASGTTSEVTEQILSLLDKTETNEELVKAFSANIRGKFEKEGFTL